MELITLRQKKKVARKYSLVENRLKKQEFTTLVIFAQFFPTRGGSHCQRIPYKKYLVAYKTQENHFYRKSARKFEPTYWENIKQKLPKCTYRNSSFTFGESRLPAFEYHRLRKIFEEKLSN